jgi:hypothetical protein
MHSRTELFVVDVTRRTEFELQLTYKKSTYFRLKYVVPLADSTYFVSLPHHDERARHHLNSLFGTHHLPFSLFVCGATATSSSLLSSSRVLSSMGTSINPILSFLHFEG